MWYSVPGGRSHQSLIVNLSSIGLREGTRGPQKGGEAGMWEQLTEPLLMPPWDGRLHLVLL